MAKTAVFSVDLLLFKSTIPGLRGALDVDNAQGPDVSPAPMVPYSLNNPYELRPVVGAALVNDDLEPRVVVQRARDVLSTLRLSMS